MCPKILPGPDLESVERFRKIMLMVKQPKAPGRSKQSDLVIMREGLSSI